MSDTKQPPLSQALSQLGQDLATWAKTAGKMIIEPMAETMHQAYQQAGSPYGDTHEGLMRWLEDVKEIRRHEAVKEPT